MIIGEYSPTITEPEANNCFSINTQVIISEKRKKKQVQRKIIFPYSGKTTTGSHFVRPGFCQQSYQVYAKNAKYHHTWKQIIV